MAITRPLRGISAMPAKMFESGVMDVTLIVLLTAPLVVTSLETVHGQTRRIANGTHEQNDQAPRFSMNVMNAGHVNLAGLVFTAKILVLPIARIQSKAYVRELGSAMLAKMDFLDHSVPTSVLLRALIV